MMTIIMKETTPLASSASILSSSQVWVVEAFSTTTVLPASVTASSAWSRRHPPALSSSSSHLGMSLIDDLKLIFSDEGKKNKKAYEARERAEQEAAQQEILRRRRNPELMEQYEQDVTDKRAKLQVGFVFYVFPTVSGLTITV